MQGKHKTSVSRQALTAYHHGWHHPVVTSTVQ